MNEENIGSDIEPNIFGSTTVNEDGQMLAPMTTGPDESSVTGIVMNEGGTTPAPRRRKWIPLILLGILLVLIFQKK